MTILVWDWNGTLYQDVEAGLDCINTLLERYDLPLLKDVEAYRNVFNFPVKDYYETLGFDFSRLDWDQVANEFMDLYQEHVPELKLYPEALEVLRKAREDGMKNVILSASQLSKLKEQMEPFGLESLIGEVFGISNIYAHSKEELAHELKKRYPQEEIFFIGDTLHDAEVAQAIGAPVILVSQGHHSKERLQKSGQPVVTDLEEALEEVKRRME